MMNGKVFGDLVRKGTEAKQVKKIKISRGRLFVYISFQPVPCHTADGTTGAVFKDDLYTGFRQFFDPGKLLQAVEFDPVHIIWYLGLVNDAFIHGAT